MKLRYFFGITALASLLLASCYPVNEHPGKPRGTTTPPDKKQPALTPEQLKAKEAEELKKKEEAAKNEEPKKDNEVKPDGTTGGDPISPPPGGKKEEAKKAGDYSVANKVPGKDGFVFSPYNNKVVDVRDIPPGTLVQDPTYPASEKKYFRVP